MKTRLILTAVAGAALCFAATPHVHATNASGDGVSTPQTRNAGVTHRALLGEGERSRRNPGSMFEIRPAAQPRPTEAPVVVMPQPTGTTPERVTFRESTPAIPIRRVVEPVAYTTSARPTSTQAAVASGATPRVDPGMVVSRPATGPAPAATADASTAPWDIHAFNRPEEREPTIVEGIRYPFDPDFD